MTNFIIQADTIFLVRLSKHFFPPPNSKRPKPKRLIFDMPNADAVFRQYDKRLFHNLVIVVTLVKLKPIICKTKKKQEDQCILLMSGRSLHSLVEEKLPKTALTGRSVGRVVLLAITHLSLDNAERSAGTCAAAERRALVTKVGGCNQ